MELQPHPPFDLPVPEAARLQVSLRERLRPGLPPSFEARLVAGADVSIVRGRDTGHGALVVMDLESGRTVAEATASVAVGFPYVPGLLSFRELPPLAAAWERLRVRPDVVLFDGHGRAHPRRFGLACHGGVLFGVPSVGVAKSLLVGTVAGSSGEGEAGLGRERGAVADLVHEDERVGRVLRTRTGVRPVYVSSGHRMELDAAVEIVLRASPRYRLSEPIRRAHRLCNRVRTSGASPARP